MNRQAEIALRPEKGGATFAVAWKLCDNGFTLQGQASWNAKTRAIQWMNEEPPIEDQGLLRELILARVHDAPAGE